MNESKHTPGPWRAVGTFVEGGGRAIAKAVLLAKSNLAGEGSENELGKANARLIAAAPEMENTLNEIVGMVIAQNIDGLDRTGKIYEIARAAIAKAKGE